MEKTPIVSIFLATGGAPVARGVLAWGVEDGERVAAGLFAPWPESVGVREAFCVHVAGARQQECLTPAEVGIVDMPGSEDAPSLGVVTFTSAPEIDEPPAHEIPEIDMRLEEDPERLRRISAGRDSWLDIMAEEDPEVFGRLREVSRTTDERSPLEEPPPEYRTAVGRPQQVTVLRLTAANADAVARRARGSFLCRVILRRE